MKLAITGTPGTGKTTATELLDVASVVHLNDAIEQQKLYTDTDRERDSKIADIQRINEWLGERDPAIVESHLAHRFEADRIIVLRCHPEQLRRRLRERGASAAKAEENAEAEALDLILTETVNRHGTDVVYEIDTTDREPRAVAREIERVLEGEREPSASDVEFTEYL